MEKPRFSMLLLEPGELYFEDFSCSMREGERERAGSGGARRRAGRLKLCSKSLVFEPRGGSAPLIKLQYRDTVHTAIVPPTATGTGSDNVICVKVKQYAEMLEDNIVAPYTFHYTEKSFYFTFDFASAEACLSQVQQLHRASTLSAGEHNSMIATISHSRYMRTPFDKVLMEDFSEEVLLELPAERVSPLVRNPGRLALTPTALYFQPFNNIDSSRVLQVKLSAVRRVFPRRFLLRQVGLEMYSDGGGGESEEGHVYLVLESEAERAALLARFAASPVLRLQRTHPEEMTLQWQNRLVSNYDYLLYLNSLADRSKNDLTQYPIFPWVLANYRSESLDLEDARVYRDLSRPIGALHPPRLLKLRERYDEMSEPKFLYGSHYSAPALVLFYLVRKYPHYMLCLQNGRFDHPDRMFNSLADAFHNCLHNMSDFKELVPEFYDTESKGDFLQNVHEIEFGERHDGRRVGDVALPAWASSPAHLVHTLRAALESDHVSQHLHLWIDLIFGYKQRGVEAVRSNNVFHHVCYEGSVELDEVWDMNERHALEVQIMEFGQVPKQLFTKPHARRLPRARSPPSTAALHPPHPHPPASHEPVSLELLETIQIHRESATCVQCATDAVVSTGRDGALKVWSRARARQVRSVALAAAPLTCCALLPPAHTVAAGSCDNHIYLYNLEFGRLLDSFRAHDDSVSCLLWLAEEEVLVSGGLDCVVRVWAELGRGGQALKGLRAELEHDGKVTALAALRRGEVAAGTSDGEVYVWRVASRELVLRLRDHRAPVRALCFLSYGERLLSAADDAQLNVTDLNIVHTVYNKKLAEEVCAAACDGDRRLWLGGRRGTLLQWDLLSFTQQCDLRAHTGAINSMCWQDAGVLLTAGEDAAVKLWRPTPTATPPHQH